MAIPALEYREQLLAQGCEEGLVDAISALIEVAPNDAAAEVIMQAGEQAAGSEEMVIKRLNAQISRNREQSSAVNSVLDEIAHVIKMQPEQGIVGSDPDRSQILRAVAETRAKNSRQQQAENARLHAVVAAARDRLLAEYARARRKYRQAADKADKRLLWFGVGLQIAGPIIALAAVIALAVFT